MEASGHEQEVTPKNQTHHHQIRSAPARSGARQSRGFEQSHQPRRPTRLSSCHRQIRRLVLFRTAFSVEPDSGLTLILSFGIPTTRSWHNQPPPRGRAPVSNRILEAVVLRLPTIRQVATDSHRDLPENLLRFLNGAGIKQTVGTTRNATQPLDPHGSPAVQECTTPGARPARAAPPAPQTSEGPWL